MAKRSRTMSDLNGTKRLFASLHCCEEIIVMIVALIQFDLVITDHFIL